MSYIEYAIDSVLVVMYLTNTYLILKKISLYNEEDDEKRIKKMIRDYVISSEFRNMISQAINDTQLTKDFQAMKLTLCTRIEELKNTKICNNGSS
uniref:Uncharacterized protein n=1 Tax=Candidatus Aramenus sulfurataquae TaxID=1326980 RepID=A0A0F2LKS7_9CREN